MNISNQPNKDHPKVKGHITVAWYIAGKGRLLKQSLDTPNDPNDKKDNKSKKTGIIYHFHCPKCDEQYVGGSHQLETRFKEHINNPLLIFQHCNTYWKRVTQPKQCHHPRNGDAQH